MKLAFVPLVIAIASSGCTCTPPEDEPDASPILASPANASSTSTAVVTANATNPTTPEAPPKSLAWSATKIDWQPLDAGLKRAKSEKKPVCLVFYTEWCPHCRAYTKVFDDSRVIARAHDFVMIRVDADAEPEANTRYAPDGKYIPRTFFLTSDGTLDASLSAGRPKFQFFYDENDAGSLLAGMSAATRKLAKL